MNKSSAAVVTAAILLLLTGCSGAPEAAPGETQGAGTSAKSAPEETTEPVETPAAEDATPAYITEPGEVCDPGNMNDLICAAFYPDQVVLNVTSRNPELASIPEADRIALAHESCDNPSDNPIHTAAALAYCNEQIGDSGFEGMPDRNARIIAFYQALGEDAARAHFADKTMPTAAELGV